jgi:hypothetical protein
MWTQTPEAALEIATGLHRERVARAQLHLARHRRHDRATTTPPSSSQPFSRLISSIFSAASAIRRDGADRDGADRDGAIAIPCPTGC